jgi:hypothetical protein
MQMTAGWDTQISCHGHLAKHGARRLILIRGGLSPTCFWTTGQVGLRRSSLESRRFAAIAVGIAVVDTTDLAIGGLAPHLLFEPLVWSGCQAKQPLISFSHLRHTI